MPIEYSNQLESLPKGNHTRNTFVAGNILLCVCCKVAMLLTQSNKFPQVATKNIIESLSNFGNFLPETSKET